MDQRSPVSAPPRPVRADVRILVERCKGCRFCVEFCPMGTLDLSEAFNAKGYRYPVVREDNCVDCKLCLRICPEYAIYPIARQSGTGDEERGAGVDRAAAHHLEGMA